MKTYKYFLILLLVAIPSIAINAQIGYQVSLLNSATGQPRAGETVNVNIKLTDCEQTTIYATQQKATSNDFGVLSLSVGNANTFDKLEWDKLPLFIEVSIDGVVIAKSQVLSVPVAEYAKRSGAVPTNEFLASKTWKYETSTRTFSVDFNINGEFIYRSICKKDFDCFSSTTSGNYYISNNLIYCSYYSEGEKHFMVLAYNHILNSFIIVGDGIGFN